MAGKVYFVGAGPGSADLLTLRAVAVLRAADVVLHDDLVTPEVLALSASTSERVNVGKRYGRKDGSPTQESINHLIVWHASNGSVVVRLKSGDPAIYGRLGEELDAVRRAGIDFEIVPGISALTAAAASAEVTLTDRRAASSLVILTAHNCRGEEFRARGLDPQTATFAVYMPGPDYARTSRDLLASGVDGNTPCVLVSNAGRSTSESCFMTVSDLPFVIGVPAPAILIVGEVARGAEMFEAYQPPAIDGTSVTSSPSANW
ncbi:MAG TPA: uroporphyrinogen-III C-methyltransferase [Candidatus Limnocylindrales bacterium]|nr:uroporphyrinogen-III C-methyltransferase [Candidatus Limnocylindrales bacterium]